MHFSCSLKNLAKETPQATCVETTEFDIPLEAEEVLTGVLLKEFQIELKVKSKHTQPQFLAYLLCTQLAESVTSCLQAPL